MMIQEIWKYHPEFREEKELRSGSEEPLQPMLLLCFSRKAKESLDDINCLESMTHHDAGIGIQSYLPSEMHPGKFPDHTEFLSWMVDFRVEVCGSRKSKQPNRWMTSSLQNQERVKISLIMIWRQH